MDMRLKPINWKRSSRQWHYWGAIIIAIPILVVILSGLLLQVKKQVEWVQPPTARGTGDVPMLTFAEILAAAQTVPEAEIAGWGDVDRLDVRPGKGIVKVRAENRWEIQVDTQTGAVVHVAYRRSDLIESIHDGSFFSEPVKLWVFLPSAVVLLGLWVTGMYLFALPFSVRWRKRLAQRRQVIPRAVPATAGGPVEALTDRAEPPEQP